MKDVAYKVDKYGRIETPYGDPISVPDDAGTHFFCDVLNSEFGEIVTKRSVTMMSYSLHDKIVKILEERLRQSYLDRERARAERDEAKANRKYAPPVVVRFHHAAWDDGDYVVTADGDPVGGAVTPNEARSIVKWLGTAWAELIEHNTMKHVAKCSTASAVDAFGNAVIARPGYQPPSPQELTE